MDTNFHSLEWMHELRDAEIPEALKLLGYVHMAYANPQGLMRPTQEQLALATPKDLEADTSAPVSTKTIQRRRNRLVRLGWMQRVEKGNGRGRASVYRLTFPPINADWEVPETRTETRTGTLPETRTGQSDQERHQELSTRAEGNGSKFATMTEDELAALLPPGVRAEDLPDW